VASRILDSANDFFEEKIMRNREKADALPLSYSRSGNSENGVLDATCDFFFKKITSPSGEG